MGRADYDAVVVGSRVAGAPTAMLLARRGLRVLLVDKARFPSDAVSSHQVQVPGAAALHRWGLLGQVVGYGGCAVSRARLTVGGVTVAGNLPTVDGVHDVVSPRRTRLDDLLVRAAAAAGAEVETRFTVEDVHGDGDRVRGVRGRLPGRGTVTVSAGLVVGADGKRSTVAAAVGAAVRRRSPQATIALYSYWDGLPVPEAQLYHLPGRALAAFPTDDGRTVVFAAAPRAEQPAVRRDPGAFLRRTLDRCGSLRASVGSATLVERIRVAPDLPHELRAAHGPGWALVGDAGLVLDPVTAQGISNAFRSAELLDRAIGRAVDLGLAPDGRLASYERDRDAAFRGMFDLTSRLAALRPGRRDEALLRSLAGRPERVDRLLAVFSGVEPPQRYFRPADLARTLGWAGLADVFGLRPARAR